MEDRADIVVVGAGAAGLMSAIWAARSRPGIRILVLDGARRLGAKILIAGGGRCNVTHDRVTEKDFAGSSRHAIRNVLKRFDVPATIAFFDGLGVELKREDSGKLFPTTDRASTVLSALLDETRRQGVELVFPRRVQSVTGTDGAFAVGGPWGSISANRVVLATGGQSVPKTGSDGHGFTIARALGHRLTSHIFPGLVSLVLAESHFVRRLSGVTVPATLTVVTSSGKAIVSFTDSTLCTHFGLSGPSVLDISRYYTAAMLEDPGTRLVVSWLPGESATSIERDLQAIGATAVATYLKRRLPARLADALCAAAGVDSGTRGDQLNREDRKARVIVLTRLPLPVIGDRGFKVAEVTAGGIPLDEINPKTMESRVCRGLYLCGEICDVDGRVGGFNFQWAWSSGYVTGVSCSQT